MTANGPVVILLAAVLAAPAALAQDGGVTQSVIRKALRGSPFRNVQVSVSDDVVTLGGSVGLYRYRSIAEDHVSRVHGVALIRNEIQIASPAISDRQLRKNVQEAMVYSEFQNYGHLPTADEAVSVEVENGVVRLSGAVSTGELASRLFAVAADTRGVKGIVDRMQVVSESPAAGR